MNVNHLIRYEELGVELALAVRLLEDTMSARQGPGGGPRHVDVCAMLPSLGSLSINDAPSPPPALPGADSLRPAPGGSGEMIDYSMGKVEDIGVNKDDKKRKIEKDDDTFEWYTKVELPDQSVVWQFNYNRLNMYLRKENTENNWIFWYPWMDDKPGIFNFGKGIYFSDFVINNSKNKGIVWDSKYVDGNGTHHPNPHYLRQEWTKGFTIEYLSEELQEKRYKKDPNWWVTWDKDKEDDKNMVTREVEKRDGCPANKIAMIEPFLKWLEEHHERTQKKRKEKEKMYTENPKDRAFMIKHGTEMGSYRAPVPPLTWGKEKFRELLVPWFALKDDTTPEGNTLDEFAVHVKLLDPTPGTGKGKLEPPPGFIAYRRGMATGANVPKPGDPKPKNQSFKVDEVIYVGPRWKQWLKGQDGEKNDKGFLMVRELSPRACWLTYINAQSSGSSGNAGKQAKAKVAEDDTYGQAKKDAAATLSEQNKPSHSRQEAARDPMRKRKKEYADGTPADSDEDDDDDEEDEEEDEEAVEAVEQPLPNRPGKSSTLEEMRARRLALRVLASDDDDE